MLFEILLRYSRAPIGALDSVVEALPQVPQTGSYPISQLCPQTRTALEGESVSSFNKDGHLFMQA